VSLQQEREQKVATINQKIKERVSFMLLNSIPIWNLDQIRTAMEEKQQVSLTNKYISGVFRKQLGLGYRKV